MGSRILRMDVGRRSLDLSGSLSLDESSVQLSGAAVSASVDRVFAVVEGPAPQRLELLAKISASFAPGGPADELAPGGEEDFLRQILGSIDRGDVRGQRLSAAMAICVRDSVVGCSVGGSRVVVVRTADGAVQPPCETPLDAGLRVWRTKIMDEDAVVLIGESIRQTLNDYEIRQSVHGCDPEDASAWLATLGCSRAQRHSTALVATRHAGDKARPGLSQLDPPVLSARSFAPSARFVAIGVVAIAALAMAVVLAPLANPGASHASTYLPPLGLTSSVISPTHVVLSWQGRPGVSDYLVQIDNTVHDTKTDPSLDLNRVLRPGQTYGWRVKALYGPTSPSGWRYGPSFSVPRVISVSHRPLAVSPRARVVTHSETKAVQLCWTAPDAATTFDLRISGGGLAVRRTVKRAMLSAGPGGSRCKRQVLPSGRISWLVGAEFQSGQVLWSRWNHVVVVSKIVEPAVTELTTDNQSATQSTTSGSTVPASTSGTSATTTTTSTTTSSTTSSPSSSSPVKVCSNPPHC